MEQNTQDFSKFGLIELDEAEKLLKEYANNPNVLDGNGIKVEFNPNSGNVFLVDEDYNVAMMNGDTLEQFYTCPQCGFEGFLEDMNHEPVDDECTEYMEGIGVEHEEKR